tara:strand:+ start:1199 stop:1438 length:240 start_codon:yes stop_codon:yes gene_type:complete
MQTLGLPLDVKAVAVSMLVFMLVSAPMTYKLTNGLARNVGLKLAESNGCPTMTGLAVHALVFVLLKDVLFSTLFAGLNV